MWAVRACIANSQAFYEETRSILLRRRPAGSASQALTTGEGILAGMVAGESASSF